MSRKQSDKKQAKKKGFFGNHLEIKPSFMQKPKSMEEVMAEAFSPAPANAATAAVDATVATRATIAPTPTAAPAAALQALSAVALPARVADSAAAEGEVPARLAAEVARLSRLNGTDWQPALLAEVAESSYWRGYALAWHWLEDELLGELDKDSKLALRRCYRKAFGSGPGEGHFFAGQSGLAQEIGLSKRRVQDIMEIFHRLGWVVKLAHFNRGNKKGTEYQMRLPAAVRKLFLEPLPKQ